MRYFLRNGPLSMWASLLPGLANYVVVLFLAYQASPSAVGEYRALLSVFALLGVAALDVSSVHVRLIALREFGRAGTLFVGQLYATVATTALAAAGVAVAYMLGFEPPTLIGAVLIASVLYYPFELFKAHLQATQRFAPLAVAASGKWAAALIAFGAAYIFTKDVAVALLAQLAILVASNAILFVVFVRRDLELGPPKWSPVRAFRSKDVREAAIINYSNFMPGAIEQVDKLLVGAVFGAAALGVYTIGFSTGRLVYNALKPTLGIYYKRFVERMPKASHLLSAFVVFSLLGLTAAVAFAFAAGALPALAPLRAGVPVATVLFLSYGVAMVDALYSQAYAINRRTNSAHVFTASVAASVACGLVFFVGAQQPVEVGLIVFALYYPCRHGVSIVVLALLGASERDANHSPDQ